MKTFAASCASSTVRRWLLLAGMVLLATAPAHAQTADLAVSKIGVPEPVGAGNNLTYTVTITNAGPDAASVATLTDVLPAGVTFVSAAGCTELSGVVTCIFGGGVAANGSVTATIVVTPTGCGRLITNAVSVAGVELDPNLNDNTNASVNTITANVSATGPASVANACPGSAVNFTVTASGSGPFTYTWRKGVTVVQGPDGNNTYAIASVTAGDADTYSVVVENGCNAVTNSATLTVAASPVITVQPQPQTTPVGNGAVFSVTATGPSTPASLTYQWQTNGIDVTGATASSLAVSNLTLADSGREYRVIVSNCAGSVTSTSVVLTVTPIFGISFDWDSPGQYTNTFYNVQLNDWLHNVLPPVFLEVPTRGAGGSGALDVLNGSTADASMILAPASYDFSLDGKTLVASTMVRVKAPTVNGRNTQVGFVTATNVWSGTAPGLTAAGVADATPQGFMTVILQSTAQPALTYELRFQHRRTDGTITEVTAPTGRTPASVTLTAGNWYRVTAKFTNIKGTTANTLTVEGTLEDMGASGTGPATVIQSFPANNVANPSLVSTQKNMFLAVRHGSETTGVDMRDTTWAASTSGNIFFVAQPANQTVQQGRRATFRAMVDGDGPYTYQWSKNGDAIPGARSWKYTTPPVTLGDDTAEYVVSVTGPNNSISSSIATLFVTSDPLAVVSVGSVDGCLIGVRFNQALDPVTAANPANYLINGTPAASARVHVSNIAPHGADGTSVILTPASVIGGAFTVTVQNVQDLSGGVIGGANSAGGTVAGLVGVDINPAVAQPAGQQISFADGSFEVTGGGVDIFSAPDSFRYVYTTRSGDFDVKVRVPYQDIVRAPGKSGFHVRTSLDPTCPMVLASLNPPWPARGLYEGTFRQVYNVGGTSWGAPGTVARYPNTWLRFRRVANSFLRYSSTNGQDWAMDGNVSPNPALPETVLLGLAVCSVANGTPATAQFDGYGDFAVSPGAVITITQQPADVTTNAGSAALITAAATLTNGPAQGELAFVWQRSDGLGGWTNMPTAGATNAVLNTGVLTAADNGAQFRVIVMASGAVSMTSSIATVTVNDSTAPTVSATVIPPGGTAQIVINYSEAMGASAVNTANYSVTNGPGASLGVASAIFLHGDPRTVVLTTMSPLVAGTYGVRITGVQDLGGNDLNPNPTVRLLAQAGAAPQLGPIVAQFYVGLTNSSGTINDLIGNSVPLYAAPSVKYSNDTPDFVVYSNVFGINPLNANFPDPLNNYGARLYTYFVAPTNGSYKFYVRGDDFVQFLMNTNAAGSTNPAGAVIQVNLAANQQVYSAANSVTNTLVGGQRYYMELRYKENTGGDGGTVALRVGGDTGVPGQGEVISGSLCAFPDAVAKPTPAVVEIYTGMVTLNPTAVNDLGAAGANGSYPDLIAATNTAAFIARNPNVIGYARYFGFNTNLAQSTGATFDNYLGRIYANYMAPSNGLYKFWIRNDDSADLWMNTNAVGTDPAGMTLLGLVNDFYDGNYRLVAQNVYLTAGAHYMEGRWRDGTGGDGMTVVVRAQSDLTIPGTTEVLGGGSLAFPDAFDRVGPVDATIVPLNPVVAQGQTITFQAAGVRGSPTYGFFWLRNGVPIAANAVNFISQPMTPADHGAVYTLVVTNSFSRVERSSTVSVISDSAAPTLVGAVGSYYQDIVVLRFSEQLDSGTGGCAANYRINNNIQVLSATLDLATRRRVTLRTTAQTPGAGYEVTVNGVRDAAGNAIAANSTIRYKAWIASGCGFYVELFTNIAGTAVANLVSDPKFINDWPDFSFYTNRFGAGWFGNDTGLNNYGARIITLFSPATNGLYRFYIRGDDGTQLYMNTNGPAAAGRVLIARNDGANSGTFDNGTDANIGLAASASPILTLNAGTLYYMEALLKEGGGGDHVEVAMRPMDAGGTTLAGGLPAVSVNELLAGQLFATVGDDSENPPRPERTNTLTVVQSPPPDTNVVENDWVLLRGSAYASDFELSQVMCYQWQKYNGSGGFTNLPAASGPTYSFYASPADDGQQYRLIISSPGTNVVYPTTVNVAADNKGPQAVSVHSLDGLKIGVCFSEAVSVPNPGEGAEDVANYLVNGGAVNVISASIRPDRRSVQLTLDGSVGGEVTVQYDFIYDLIGNLGSGSATGVAQTYATVDVGAPLAVGSSFSSATSDIDVIAGGNDIWGTADVGHLTLTPRTGDFDVRVRVQSLTRPDPVAKAGIMVRETLDANSRTLYCDVNPPQFQLPDDALNPNALPGRDLGEAGQRFATGGATAAWAARPESLAPIQVAAASANLPCGIPNAWIRVKRQGNLFTAFRSYDGVNWSLYAQCPFNFGDTVYVGLASCAHTATQSPTLFTTVEYRDYYLPPPPVILVQPASQNVARHANVTLSVTASNPAPNITPLSYQWSRNGVAIPGATGPSLNIPDAMASDVGTYTVRVSNDGGSVVSAPAVLTVGSPPVANTDMLMATQNMVLNIPAATLLGNDTDSDNDPLSIVAVSGVYPASYSADFSAGVPGDLAIFGSAAHEPVTGSLLINPSANSAAGSAVLPDLTPNRRVTAFTANFNLRVFDGTAEPADGFSFNFASDVPLAANTTLGENGAGSGFSFCVDNYRFLPYPQGGVANTSGLKIRYRGLEVIGVRIPTWNSPRFVPIAIEVTAEGKCTVRVDGTNVFGTVNLPNYLPTTGRFGMYGRCGGAFESHAVDDLSVTVLTLETSRDPLPNPNAPALFGSAYGDGAVLHLTDNVNNQAGSYIVNELTPGVAVESFTASFTLRIGNASAEPADGFSFNFAGDLPIGATTPAAAENGGGTGFSFCVDNYRFAPYPGGGTANTSGMKIRYGGVDVAGVQIPTWNSTTFVPVSITVASDGSLTVLVNGTNVFGALTLPWVPSVGRFGIYARTGGQNETHWVDNLSINATTAGGPAAHANDFNSLLTRYGTVVLSGGNVIYNPPFGLCGPDSYYYLVKDGPDGSTSIGRVDVNIKEVNPVPPVIVTCATNRFYVLNNGPTVVLPDLTGEIVATDNCCCFTISQSPAPGTVLSEGQTVVTFTVTNSGGLTASCQATITVKAPPTIMSPIYDAGAGTFSASFMTISGCSYTVKYSDDVEDSPWLTLETFVGNGSVHTFTDPGPLPSHRFYVVIVTP